MSSLDVAFAVFERWKTEDSLLRVFTPEGEGIASSHSAKIVSVDATARAVRLIFDDDRRSKTWVLANARCEYVDASEDDETPEELKRSFAGRFLKIELPSGQLFVVGELIT